MQAPLAGPIRMPTVDERSGDANESGNRQRAVTVWFENPETRFQKIGTQ